MNRLKVFPLLVVVCALALGVAVRADNDHGSVDEQHAKLLGTISVPGPKAIASTDIAWADQTTGW